MDTYAGLFALVGIVSFAFVVLAFLLLRQINRLLITLLGVGFVCFGLSLGFMSVEDFQLGVASIPSGRYTTSEITRELHPTLFWASTVVVWLGAAGLSIMGFYLFKISLMRRRA